MAWYYRKTCPASLISRPNCSQHPPTPPRPQAERFNPLVGSACLDSFPSSVRFVENTCFCAALAQKSGSWRPEHARVCAYAHARVRTCTTPKTSAKQVINNDTCARVRLAGMRTITRVCVCKNLWRAPFSLWFSFSKCTMILRSRACA